MRTRMTFVWCTMVSVTMVLGAVPAVGALTGQWTLNDGSGPTAQDSVGPGNHNGTLNGDVGFAIDGADGTLAHGGTDSGGYVDMGGAGDFDMSSPSSLELWVKITQMPVGSRDVMMFGKTNTGWGQLGISVTHTGVNQLRFNYVFSTNLTALKYVINTDTVADPNTGVGTWYHIVGKYDPTASDSRWLYVNGSQVTSDWGGGPTHAASVTGTALKIGDSRSTTYTSGSVLREIDEARFYDHVVSVGEIQASYAAGPVPVPEPGSMVLIGIGSLVVGMRRRSK